MGQTPGRQDNGTDRLYCGMIKNLINVFQQIKRRADVNTYNVFYLKLPNTISQYIWLPTCLDFSALPPKNLSYTFKQ